MASKRKTSSMTVITGKQGFQQKLQEIENLVKSHSKIPKSVSQGKTFKFDTSDNRGWNELEQLLTKHGFGATISNAVFVVGGTERDSNRNPWNRDFYNTFQRCLAKLPNLRSLSIGEQYGIMSLSFDVPEVVAMKEQHENIDIFLPELARLEKLEITEYSVTLACGRGCVCVNLEEFLQAVLLKYSSQLQKLTLPSQIWKDEYGTRLHDVTEFHLDLEPRSPPSLHSILASLQCPKLNNVELKVLVGGISVKQIIEAIQLRPTVKTLTIRTCGINDHVSREEILSTVLPNVTSLKLENIFHDDMVPPASFLKCFPGLEYLKIENDRPSKRKREDPWDELRHPNFRVGTGNIGDEKISIWNLFPKMKTFVLEGDTYSGEMYRRH